jgi:CRISPR-associated protein Cas1
MKRIVLLSSKCFASVKDGQFVLRFESEITKSLPIEDLGYLEIDTPQVTITSAALADLVSSGVTLGVCDTSHQPAGLLSPLVDNILHAQRLQLQVAASEPTRKQAWQETIKWKIRNQADAIRELGGQDATLRRKVALVRTDDRTNQEGAAAAAYWKVLLSPFGTKRDPDGAFPNNMLNYGYAVLRACMARALVASGLHPALGIKHSNRNNAFALADDMMEPYRPFIDRLVIPLAADVDPQAGLVPSVKKEILGVLNVDTYWPEGRRPLQNAVLLTAQSLVKVFAGEAKVPVFPRMCE